MADKVREWRQKTEGNVKKNDCKVSSKKEKHPGLRFGQIIRPPPVLPLFNCQIGKVRGLLHKFLEKSKCLDTG